MHWLIGVAQADVTPREPLWLGGYGGRSRPADGVLHPLRTAALALTDASGRRGVFISSDQMGFAPETVRQIQDALHRELGLCPADIFLTASHNHCGPVLSGALIDYYGMSADQWAAVDRYTRDYVEVVVRLAQEAFDHAKPGELLSGEGRAEFAVNRRNNRETEVPAPREEGRPLLGPTDHSVPVLAARSTAGDWMAIAYGYACHPTVLSDYHWCGDYPGFAALAMEREFPGVVPMFWTGCGGDQNPLPRRTVELCRSYGEELAQSVRSTVGAGLERIEPELRTAYHRVELPFEHTLSPSEFEPHLDSPNSIRRRWSRRWRQRLLEGMRVPGSVEYPVRVWRLGKRQLWIGLGAEAVVDYSLRFRREYGPHTWICGYSDEMLGYIPSRRVWEEGGYEGGFLFEYGHPAERWRGDVEDRISAGVAGLVDAVFQE